MSKEIQKLSISINRSCYFHKLVFNRFFVCVFLRFKNDFIALRNTCLKPPYPRKFVTPCHKIDDPTTIPSERYVIIEWSILNYPAQAVCMRMLIGQTNALVKSDR